MWSNIFSLVLRGLGPLQGQASSLLIMAISGAAVLPPLQGAVVDRFGLQSSFWVPLLAMTYVTVYALYQVRKTLFTILGVRDAPRQVV
jgi:FHS family L-fucose permease-like MFS transporter